LKRWLAIMTCQMFIIVCLSEGFTVKIGTGQQPYLPTSYG